MKKIAMCLCVICSVFVFLDSAGAYPYSGEFMFTVVGNDPASNAPSPHNVAAQEDLAIKIEDWFLSEKNTTRDIDIEFYAKVEWPSTGDSTLSLTYDPSHLFGTWSTGNQKIEFYSVKGGNEYAMYWLDGGASFGFWSTEHLTNGGDNVPAISHFSAWNPIEPVPEPATMVLLGCGLLGLVGVSRKKLRK